MRIINTPPPPTGLRRWLFRLPIHLYRMGLGPLFGQRFMLLTHIGRVSGRRRHIVIEVVHHDGPDYIAASGYGTRSDWYRNVLAHPDVTIQIGNRTIPVTATPLSTDEGERIMGHYAMRHPTAARQLCRLMGFAVDGSEADFREVGRHIPFLKFTARTTSGR